MKPKSVHLKISIQAHFFAVPGPAEQSSYQKRKVAKPLHPDNLFLSNFYDKDSWCTSENILQVV